MNDQMRNLKTGIFMISGKPTAPIRQISSRYYVLQMGEREIGGGSKSALENYARKCGFIPVVAKSENGEGTP